MVTHPTLQNASLRSRYLLNRFVEDRLNASAAALTFVSLFALVPLLTVTQKGTKLVLKLQISPT